MLIFIFAFLSNSLEISNFHYLYVLDNDLSIENVNDQNGKNHSTNIYKNNAFLTKALSLQQDFSSQHYAYHESRVVVHDYLSNISYSVFKDILSTSMKYLHSEGGAIFSSGINLFVDNCFFIRNRAYQTGGAIRIKSSPKIVIKNSFFDNNQANQFSGAISNYVIYECAISSTNFTKNLCDKEVSTISFSICDFCEMSNVLIYKNKCNQLGSIFIEASEVLFKFTTFYQNFAIDYTSIYVDSDSFVSINNSNFISAKCHSCFISDNSASTFYSCYFTGSKESEIQGTCQSNTIIDSHFCVVDQHTFLFEKTLPPRAVTFKQAFNTEKFPEPKIINVNSSKEELIITAVMVTAYIASLIFIYFIVKFINKNGTLSRSDTTVSQIKSKRSIEKHKKRHHSKVRRHRSHLNQNSV